jgi:hypothetical protein
MTTYNVNEDSIHTMPDVIKFLWAAGIHKYTGVMSCEESIAHCTKWFEDRGYSLYDAPVKRYIDEALADPNLEPGFRKGLQMYLQEYRSILFVLGREGLEDAGQWRVIYPDYDDNWAPKKVIFGTREEAEKFISDYADDHMLEDDILHYIWLEQDGERVPATVDDLHEYSKRQKFIVVDYFGNEVECLRDEVEDQVKAAINNYRNDILNKFNFHKRVKPKGDPLWGNWWKPVRVKSI